MPADSKTAITLPARPSRILAGTLKYTPDGRDIDAARREARALAMDQARKILRREGVAPADIEIYSCARYGGSLLDVINVPAGLSL